MKEMNKKVLIIFYSWSGNTRAVALSIQEQTGGELFELDPVMPYPAAYSACVEQAKKEIKVGFIPNLIAVPANLDKYDMIFIGTPVWWYTMAPPLLTFLQHADLAGKKVAPFCTHGGGGKGSFTNDVEKVCSTSSVLDELVLYGDGEPAAEQVAAWLQRIGMTKDK